MRLWKLVAPTVVAALVAAVAWGGIYDYSKTAASNTTIESISAAVGALPPSNVGPLFRANASVLKKWQEDIGCAVTTGGSANVHTFNALSDPYSGAATFADGDTFCFIAGFTNTSTVTLNVESEGAKAVRKLNDLALTAGDIVVGAAYTAHYDASANSAAGAWILDTQPYPVEAFCVAASDEITTIVTANDKIHWRMPYAFTVTDIRGALTGPSTSGTFTADVHEGGTTIMASAKLVFDANEETTTTAATAPVVSDPSLADDAEMSIDVDDDGTSAEGLKICLIGRRT